MVAVGNNNPDLRLYPTSIVSISYLNSFFCMISTRCTHLHLIWGFAFFFFFFWCYGVWTQDLEHARQGLYHVSQVSSLFGLVIFWIGSHVQAGLDPNPLIYAPVHHHAQLFVRWSEVWWIFCPGWPRIMILQISTTQVARSTCMSLCTWLIIFNCVFKKCTMLTKFKSIWRVNSKKFQLHPHPFYSTHP